MHRRQWLHAAAATLATPLAGLALPARAQGFPSKPIRILIGFPAGGTQDVLARGVAEIARPALGQPFVIENKSGASGRIALETVKSAEPDGHTLLLATGAMMTIYPHVYRDLKYDPLKDFAPIVNGAGFDLAMNVHPSVPVNTLAEFVDWAKKQGSVNYASYGAGTPSHFLGEMLARAAGIKLNQVPYRGSAPARQDIMGGHVPVFFDTVGGTVSHLRAGRIKVLATSGAKRSPFLPDVPTFVEQGFKDLIAGAWFSFAAPAKTPATVIDRLNREFNKAIADRGVRQQLLANGMYPIGGTAAELVQTIKDDSARWGKVVKATGFTATD